MPAESRSRRKTQTDKNMLGIPGYRTLINTDDRGGETIKGHCIRSLIHSPFQIVIRSDGALPRRVTINLRHSCFRINEPK